MALRSTPVALDALRALCHRSLPRRGGYSSPAFARGLHSSATRGAFWRKSAESQATADQVPNAVPPTTVTPVNGSDSGPLSPFQVKIASLESAALQSRSKPDAKDQIALMTALRDGEELNGLIRYYEAIAFSPPPDGSEALTKSEEAFQIYSAALAQTGRLADLPAAVRRRDQRLGEIASPSSSPATAPAPAASTVSPPSPSASATPTPTPAAPSAAAPSAVSSLLSSAPYAGSAAAGSRGSGSPEPGSPLHPIHVQIAPQSTQSGFWRFLRWILSIAVWAFLFFTVTSMIMENSGFLKTGPGPAEFEPEEGKLVKFSDVHGVEEAKSELEEIVEFLKNPEKFNQLGGKLPKGVLLAGPPGTGKTLLARAVAGEAEVPFFFASGSSFEEMFVGVGAKRVRELFAAARKKAPAIIFIDELDAIGSKRSAKDQHFIKQTLNQLLVELDGFQQAEGVIIIAATNIPESLDPALTRPGRFDRKVFVGLPDVRGRIAIFNHHARNVPLADDVDPSVIARGTPGMSGADLENLVNQAAVKAAREGKKEVNIHHFEWAKDHLLMGAERRSHYVTDEAKRMTAYHEGGHALVAMRTPGAMPLHKVTVMPRGQALGITFQLPEADKDSYSRQEYTARIDVSLGGRAAEDIIYGYDNVTSGCSSDLQAATDTASAMIRHYGYSDKVGLVSHHDDRFMSDKKKDEIEQEIRGALDASNKRVMNLLTTHRDELDKIAQGLMEYETLSADEVKKVLAGQRLDRQGVSDGDALKGEREIAAEKDK